MPSSTLHPAIPLGETPESIQASIIPSSKTRQTQLWCCTKKVNFYRLWRGIKVVLPPYGSARKMRLWGRGKRGNSQLKEANGTTPESLFTLYFEQITILLFFISTGNNPKV